MEPLVKTIIEAAAHMTYLDNTEQIRSDNTEIRSEVEDLIKFANTLLYADDDTLSALYASGIVLREAGSFEESAAAVLIVLHLISRFALTECTRKSTLEDEIGRYVQSWIKRQIKKRGIVPLWANLIVNGDVSERLRQIASPLLSSAWDKDTKLLPGIKPIEKPSVEKKDSFPHDVTVPVKALATVLLGLSPQFIDSTSVSVSVGENNRWTKRDVYYQNDNIDALWTSFKKLFKGDEEKAVKLLDSYGIRVSVIHETLLGGDRTIMTLDLMDGGSLPWMNAHKDSSYISAINFIINND